MQIAKICRENQKKENSKFNFTLKNMNLLNLVIATIINHRVIKEL